MLFNYFNKHIYFYTESKYYKAFTVIFCATNIFLRKHFSPHILDSEVDKSLMCSLSFADCIVKNASTPSYAAVMDSRGECLIGLGDMALHNNITIDLVRKNTLIRRHFENQNYY